MGLSALQLVLLWLESALLLHFDVVAIAVPERRSCQSSRHGSDAPCCRQFRRSLGVLEEKMSDDDAIA